MLKFWLNTAGVTDGRGGRLLILKNQAQGASETCVWMCALTDKGKAKLGIYRHGSHWCIGGGS